MLVGRKQLGALNQERFMQLRAIERLPLANGEPFDWEFADPAKLVAALLGHDVELQGVLAAAAARCPLGQPANPWHIIVGFDEFVPGNKLATDPTRKTMVLSLTFREFGQHYISNGRAWFTCIALRTSVIEQIEGGWSRCLRVFLHRLLYCPNGFATAGVPVTCGTETLLLFAKVSNLLSDGQGLAYALDWRGQGSMKPCFRHFNVIRKDGAGLHTLCFTPPLSF